MDSYTNLNQLTLEQRRRHLETLIQTPQTSYSLGKALTQLGQGMVNWLTTGSQPRITKTQAGDTEIWKVHDPISQQLLCFDHEDQVRTWLESRHNG